MYETCIAIRAEHQTIFDIIIYVFVDQNSLAMKLKNAITP